MRRNINWELIKVESKAIFNFLFGAKMFINLELPLKLWQAIESLKYR